MPPCGLSMFSYSGSCEAPRASPSLFQRCSSSESEKNTTCLHYKRLECSLGEADKGLSEMVNLPFWSQWWNPWPPRWHGLARARSVCHKARSKWLWEQKSKKRWMRFFTARVAYVASVARKLTFKRPLVQFKIQIIDLPIDMSSSNPLYQISWNLSIKTTSSHSHVFINVNDTVCELMFMSQNSLHWFSRPVSWLPLVSWASAGKRCAPAASPSPPCKCVSLKYQQCHGITNNIWLKKQNIYRMSSP